MEYKEDNMRVAGNVLGSAVMMVVMAMLGAGTVHGQEKKTDSVKSQQ